MALVQIEGVRGSTDPRLSLRSNLEGTFYRFAIRWNNRAHIWVLDIYSDNLDTLFTGHAMRNNHNMLRGYTRKEFPPGILAVVDLEGLNRDPARFAFRDTHDLIYVESE